MKYHYLQGITKKDKQGHGKLWVGFFTIFSVTAYVGFMFAVLNLNGWPLDATSSSVAVKSVKPKDSKIFIPNINVVAEGSSIKVSGDPSYSDVVVSGDTFGVGFTPETLRKASPFYNVGSLKDGDEIFLDSNGTRYVYKVTQKIGSDDQKLTIKTRKNTVVAKTVGTINWEGKEPQLETF